MGALPYVDFPSAIRAGRKAMPPGPDLSGAQIAEVVAGLRVAAADSVAPVAEVTGLSAPAGGGMHVVDRATWLEQNVLMARDLLHEASGGLDAPATVRQHVEARANGVQVGLAMAVLGSRVLGQYLPFRAEPVLILVAPNVAKIERALHVNRADFRLWVCLHEQTHRLQFAQAPWLRGYLIRKVSELLDRDGDAAGEAPGTGNPLVDLVTTPAQRVVFEQVSAVMALLEGYADVMMDRVGPAVVPTVRHIRDVFEKRRARGGVHRILNRLLGMDLKLAQYREGAAFCRAVIDRVGVEGLNVVYESYGLLPRGGEIADPDAWVRRVHG